MAYIFERILNWLNSVFERKAIGAMDNSSFMEQFRLDSADKTGVCRSCAIELNEKNVAGFVTEDGTRAYFCSRAKCILLASEIKE